MRIFLGPTEVAGFYASLRRGMEEEGVEVLFADLSGNPLRYEDRERSVLVRIVRAIVRTLRNKKQEGGIATKFARLADSPMRILLLLWAALRCDVFIYAYGGSITYYPKREYQLLRRMGRRLIFSFHGSDSRPPYLGHPGLLGANATNFAECAKLTADIKTLVRLVQTYADVIIENPFSAHLQVVRCVNAQALGNPSPEPAPAQIPSHSAAQPVRILHTPSDPALKGSDVIRAAVAEVKARGRNVELIELAGRPHSDVIDELKRCDFVVDQAYSDTPMALFATEAAAHGKAAVVGGYITPEQMAANVAPEWMPPTFYCHPNAIVDVVDRLALDETLRVRSGIEAQEFVKRQRSRGEVARRFLAVCRNEFPDDWWFNPLEIEYVQGLGEAEHIKRLIRGTVEHGGISALQLDDNPKVLLRMLAFAGIGNAATSSEISASQPAPRELNSGDATGNVLSMHAATPPTRPAIAAPR